MEAASVLVPGAGTVAILGPTIPTSAGRISPVMTSTSCPPARRTSKAQCRCGACTARERVAGSIAGCHSIGVVVSMGLPLSILLLFWKRSRVLRMRRSCSKQCDQVPRQKRSVYVGLRIYLLQRQIGFVVIGEGQDVAVVRTMAQVEAHIDRAPLLRASRIQPRRRSQFIPRIRCRVVVARILDEVSCGIALRTRQSAEHFGEARLDPSLDRGHRNLRPLCRQRNTRRFGVAPRTEFVTW